jgi:hypothetical protein
VVLYIAVPVIKENKHIICSSGDNPVAEKKVVLLSVSTTAYPPVSTVPMDKLLYREWGE